MGSLRHRLSILLAAVLFSTGGAAIKAVSLTGWQVASFRSGVAALTLGLLVPGARRGWTWRTGVVALAYASTLTLFVLANKLTTAANTIFLQSTAPLYVLLIAPLLLREKTRARDLAFMAVMGAGMAFFFVGTEPPRDSAPQPFLGNVLATTSGLSWALTLTGLRWLSRHDADRPAGSPRQSVGAVVAGNLVAFAISLPMALPVEGASLVDASTILYLGAVQIGVPYLLLSYAFERVPALEASLLILLEPVLNPVWAWWLQGEVPGGWALAGGATILFASIGRTWLDQRMARVASA